MWLIKVLKCSQPRHLIIWHHIAVVIETFLPSADCSVGMTVTVIPVEDVPLPKINVTTIFVDDSELLNLDWENSIVNGPEVNKHCCLITSHTILYCSIDT